MKKLFKYMSSIRLSVILLILITAGSFLGTVYIKYDVYHSFPFQALIGLLALNLVFCSVDRIPKIYRRLEKQKRNFQEASTAGMHASVEIRMSGSLEDVARQAESVLSRVVGGVKKSAGQGSMVLYSWRNAFAEYGPYVIHLAVLVIIAGGMIGSVFGYKGVVDLAEGERSEHIQTWDGRRILPLGFSILCLVFEVDYYESGQPKSYRTRLAVADEEGSVKAGSVIEVNHPWFYEGIGFYQQSWGIERRYLFTLTDVSDGSTDSAEIFLGERFEPEEFGLAFMPVMDSLDMDSEPGRLGADVFAHVFLKGNLVGHVRLKEGKPEEFDGYSLIFRRLPARVWTGIEVVKDPGVEVVWAGFALFCAGLIMSFMLRYQRVWVRLREDSGKVVVEISGRSRGDGASVSRRVHRIKSMLEAGAGI